MRAGEIGSPGQARQAIGKHQAAQRPIPDSWMARVAGTGALIHPLYTLASPRIHLCICCGITRNRQMTTKIWNMANVEKPYFAFPPILYPFSSQTRIQYFPFGSFGEDKLEILWRWLSSGHAHRFGRDGVRAQGTIIKDSVTLALLKMHYQQH